jgi:hypothetical protein
VNYHPNDIVLVPSVPTPPLALVSSESDTYLGLLILATFCVLFVGACAFLRASTQDSAPRRGLGVILWCGLACSRLLLRDAPMSSQVRLKTTSENSAMVAKFAEFYFYEVG